MRRKKAFFKRRSVIVASALCLLSVCGMAGIYKLESAKSEQNEKELVNWEELDTDTRQAKMDETDAPKETKKPELVNRNTDAEDGQADRLDQSQTDGQSDVGQGAVAGEMVSQLPEETPEDTSAQAQEDTAQASAQNAVNLNFQPENGMIWPVEGNVVLDYSMDRSIYFPTLDQYKYNPAIAIQSEKGTPVLASAAGVIDSIVETDETGLTMTVDLGNGYKAVYGQLADVSLSTGSYVEAGSQIATVAQPTMYYQVEGDNLYFQVTKDGTPVDPLDYIR